MSKNDSIPKEKREFLNSLLVGESIALAAKKAGVTERTGYRWMDEPDFQKVYQVAQSRLLDSAWRKLESCAGRAVDALSDVLDNPEARGANVKRLTALSLIGTLLKIKSFVDFDERLKVLEAALHGNE